MKHTHERKAVRLGIALDTHLQAFEEAITKAEEANALSFKFELKNLAGQIIVGEPVEILNKVLAVHGFYSNIVYENQDGSQRRGEPTGLAIYLVVQI